MTTQGKAGRRGRPPCGVANLVRLELRYNPRLTTTVLRKRAAAKFGYTYEIDRHFPQLCRKIRRELGLQAPKPPKTKRPA